MKRRDKPKKSLARTAADAAIGVGIAAATGGHGVALAKPAATALASNVLERFVQSYSRRREAKLVSFWQYFLDAVAAGAPSDQMREELREKVTQEVSTSMGESATRDAVEEAARRAVECDDIAIPALGLLAAKFRDKPTDRLFRGFSRALSELRGTEYTDLQRLMTAIVDSPRPERIDDVEVNVGFGYDFSPEIDHGDGTATVPAKWEIWGPYSTAQIDTPSLAMLARILRTNHIAEDPPMLAKPTSRTALCVVRHSIAEWCVDVIGRSSPPTT